MMWGSGNIYVQIKFFHNILAKKTHFLGVHVSQKEPSKLILQCIVTYTMAGIISINEPLALECLPYTQSGEHVETTVQHTHSANPTTT